MDRFKFRVWNKDDETYEKTTSFDCVFIDNDGQLRISNYSDASERLEDYTDSYIIEQCTGLKDKNGNLIYIGDIIKCGNGPLSTATVNYENGENFIDGIYPFNLYHDCGDTCHCQLRDYPEYACEIIGNVHQTKE